MLALTHQTQLAGDSKFQNLTHAKLFISDGNCWIVKKKKRTINNIWWDTGRRTLLRLQKFKNTKENKLNRQLLGVNVYDRQLPEILNGFSHVVNSMVLARVILFEYFSTKTIHSTKKVEQKKEYDWRLIHLRVLVNEHL